MRCAGIKDQQLELGGGLGELGGAGGSWVPFLDAVCSSHGGERQDALKAHLCSASGGGSGGLFWLFLCSFTSFGGR